MNSRRKLDVSELGQVFTPGSIVEVMLGLREREGRVLEPSAGDGAFSRGLKNCVAIELDAKVAPKGAHAMDFFAYPTSEKFETVIGNPPYVRYQDIRPETKGLLEHDLFDRRSNLALFFIEKAVKHLTPDGELIFIVPREFIKLTAARKLNTWLHSLGTITHWIETGDQRVFHGAVPNCAIFRFVRGDFSRRTRYRKLSDSAWETRTFVEMQGQLAFLEDGMTVPLARLFDVKVGAVSGADAVFTHPEGNLEFVCSKTRDTHETRRMLYNLKHPSLQRHKERLLARRIRAFDESNWWMWGRAYPISDAPRIYVNAKTRRSAPFFLHECAAFDGSILALFPRNPALDIQRAVELLNSAVPWEHLGFVVDGRFLFSQRTLATCMLPDAFLTLLEPKPGQRRSRKAA
ncbi:MAG: class I SAM-dependent methyltransferase [Betaproteobacteria bacterium]|nr:class I SAM-dependent methyltransferase [Betaproteobacteria bacterium]